MKIIDIIDTLLKHESRRYRRRDLAAIDNIVIHHTASRATVSPQAIARFHVRNKGWPGIAYHFNQVNARNWSLYSRPN